MYTNALIIHKECVERTYILPMDQLKKISEEQVSPPKCSNFGMGHIDFNSVRI